MSTPLDVRRVNGTTRVGSVGFAPVRGLHGLRPARVTSSHWARCRCRSSSTPQHGSGPITSVWALSLGPRRPGRAWPCSRSARHAYLRDRVALPLEQPNGVGHRPVGLRPTPLRLPIGRLCPSGNRVARTRAASGLRSARQPAVRFRGLPQCRGDPGGGLDRVHVRPSAWAVMLGEHVRACQPSHCQAAAMASASAAGVDAAGVDRKGTPDRPSGRALRMSFGGAGSGTSRRGQSGEV